MKVRRQISLTSVHIFKVAYVYPSCCHEATGHMLLWIYIGYLMINLGCVQLDTMFVSWQWSTKASL